MDVGSSTARYAQTGASNILAGDSLIVTCAVTPASITSSELVFDLVWTENAGGGGQNLFYGALDCVAQ